MPPEQPPTNQPPAPSDDLTPQEEAKFSKWFDKMLASAPPAPSNAPASAPPANASTSTSSLSIGDIHRLLDERDRKKAEDEKGKNFEERLQRIEKAANKRRWFSPFNI